MCDGKSVLNNRQNLSPLAGEGPVLMEDWVVIETKFGFDINLHAKERHGLNSRPEQVKHVAKASLKRLRINHIDQYYQRRVDSNIPIKDVAGAVKELIAEGKVTLRPIRIRRSDNSPGARGPTDRCGPE